MITTCTACGRLFVADDAEQARERVRLCRACRDAPCGTCGHLRSLHYAGEACVADGCECSEFVAVETEKP